MINPDGSTFEQKVVYEFEPRFCANCQSTTHVLEMCKKATNKSHSGKQPEKAHKSGGLPPKNNNPPKAHYQRPRQDVRKSGVKVTDDGLHAATHSEPYPEATTLPETQLDQ